MASPSNMSPWPGVTEPLSFPAPEPVERHHENITDSELILTRLREQIASGTQEPDVLLGAIAVAAQAMTDATGAALGMRRDGTVACVGRSGETAPALGAKLSENSGISGECLRNGRSQRCDDTETDPRVDAEVCRHLGLRSIAAVPIRSRLETVGILEVFSTSPHTFTEEHLNQLSSLAELADVASSGAHTNLQAIENAAPEFEPIIRPDLPILNSPWAHTEQRKHIWRYLAGAGAAVVLALFLAGSWRMWSELKSRSAEQSSVVQSPASIPSKTETVAPATSNLPAKPTPEQISSTQSATKNAPKSRGVVPASNVETEPDDGLIRNIPTAPATAIKTGSYTSANKPVETDSSASVPPQVSMVITNDDPLHGVLAPSASLPQLQREASQGATPLVLEHKVMPSYPRQAMTIRREGPVVLHAFVSDKGLVSQVKQMSGDPILGKAAIDAIRQWRYHPAFLNGKATASETDITLNFKLP